MIRSYSGNSCEAWPIEIPGKAIGMYKVEPSKSGGMDWLPILSARGSVAIRKIS
jgi:hypothetical protein